MNDLTIYMRTGAVEKALRTAKLLMESEKILNIVLDRGMIVVKTEGKRAE